MNPAVFSVTPPAPRSLRAGWRDLVQPKEHGSWSLALEPLALGLLVAPSAAGMALAVATLAGFLARRPLKIARCEREPRRRMAAAIAFACIGAVAATGFFAALAAGGSGWLVWLLPSAGAGGIFLSFDLKNRWRSAIAEIVGAAAFAGMTGVVAAAAGWPPGPVAALMFAMLARAVPTVMAVRAGVRGGKTGGIRARPALLAATAAVVGGIGFYAAGWAPGALVAALALLLGRSAIFLCSPRWSFRPRTLGFIELALGAAYVVTLSFAWRSPIA